MAEQKIAWYVAPERPAAPIKISYERRSPKMYLGVLRADGGRKGYVPTRLDRREVFLEESDAIDGALKIVKWKHEYFAAKASELAQMRMDLVSRRADLSVTSEAVS